MDYPKEPLQQSTKIDPITAVQDSIDSLALSLFEALRGVRDAVAPESLETGAAAANKNNNVGKSTVAFREAEELADNATAEERLLNGLNVDYFPPRAFDLLEPDYDAFLLAYLSGNIHAKELVDRYMKMEAWKKREDGVVQSTSSKSNDAVTKNYNNEDSNNVEIGDVGYEFRKEFDSGWYTGKVTEILLTVVGNTRDRRCVYNDGDVEDLSSEELHRLAKLDPNSKFYAKKPKISIKLMVKQTSQEEEDDDNEDESAVSKIRIPLTQEEYTQFLIDSEHQRDIQTTQRLAQKILNKSAEVDNLVATLPGMDRTRDMQMTRIEELLERNHQVGKALDEAHILAKKRLEEVRKVLGETTCLALGLEEE
jgi:hypothetical protein